MPLTSTSEKFWSEKTDAKHYTLKGFCVEWPMVFYDTLSVGIEYFSYFTAQR